MAYFSSSLKKCLWGTSLAVQWLRLPAYDARATRSIPGRGTEITCVTQPKQVFSSTENNLIFYFLNNCRIVFHSGCIILYSHKECTRVPTSLSPCQHIVSPFFFFFLKRDFPGGPVTGTLSSQCRGLELDPWLENRIPHAAS